MINEDCIMTQKSKSETMAYVFLLTVVPQLTVLFMIGTVVYLSYWFGKYNSIVHALIGIVAFIAMLFGFVAVSVFTKSYGLSIFAPTRTDFDADRYKTEPISKIDYYYGRKNLITGNRSLYVRERKISTGGPLIATAFISIKVGITGLFKFIFEGVRVLLSDGRQTEWEVCRSYFVEKMEEEGKARFFQVPIIVAFIISVSLIVGVPFGAILVEKYNPKHLEFKVTEKYNSENNNMRTHVLFYGTLTNNGHARIDQIEGRVYFKDREGNILFEDEKVVIKEPFAGVSSSDGYLRRGESWEIAFSVLSDPTDNGAQKIWGCNIDDVEIIMEISEIHYSGDKYIDFPNENDYVTVKPIIK